MSQTILDKTEDYIKRFYEESFSADMQYHNVEHTQAVVANALEIAKAEDLEDIAVERAQLAAWFHDTGLAFRNKGHEEASAELAENFLQDHDYDQEGIEEIKIAIQGTCIDETPHTTLAQILRDADTLHLGKKNYRERMESLREELSRVSDQEITETDFLEDTIRFYHDHQFFTDYAQEQYGPVKAANLKRLKLRAAELNLDELAQDIIPQEKKKKKKEEKKDKKDLERGIQTMFRNSQRTHIQLSAIADNKANIMLSVNAIILSIVVANLVPEINHTPDLLYPTILLVVVSITALVFAIMAVKPSVTHGRFTRESVHDKSANLLFFGNFHNMPMDDFEWGMKSMMDDSDFLYTSMIRDFYHLGLVLAKKYYYLRICYKVFMYGLILAGLSFIIPAF